MDMSGRMHSVRWGYWFALALAGQAGVLSQTLAGKSVRWQHLRPFWEDVSGWDAVILVALLIQGSLVAIYLFVRRSDWMPAAGRVLTSRQWLVAAIVVVALSATLSRDPRTYVVELLVAGTLALVQIITILIAVWRLPSGFVERCAGRWASWCENDRAVWYLAVISTGIAIFLAVFVYEMHPHIADEVSYLLGARIFASGRLWLPLMDVPEAFQVELMMFEDDRWYTTVPPGWPLMLALGVKLGVPWLVNPLLAGVNVVLVYFLASTLYDRRAGLACAVLITVSPWHIFLSMSYMTHTFALTCALAAALAAVRFYQRGATFWAVASGTAMGVASWVRPLEGVIVSATVGLSLLATRPRARAFGGVATMAVAATLVGGLQLAYNRLMTGHYATFPIMAYTEKMWGPSGFSNAIGFGPDRGAGWTGVDPFPGHGVIDILVNTNLNLFSVNVELFGWAGGSILFIVLFALIGRPRATDWAMFGCIAIVVAIHALYWFSGGPDFGARYWFLIIVPAVALTVRGVAAVMGRVDTAVPGRQGRARTGVTIAALIVTGIVLFVPWRAVDKYYGYRGMRPGAREALDTAAPALVFVNGVRFPDYHSAVMDNPLQVGPDSVVFVMVDRPELALEVIRVYGDRPIWILDGLSITGGRFSVRDGPMSRADFVSRGIHRLRFRD